MDLEYLVRLGYLDLLDFLANQYRLGLLVDRLGLEHLDFLELPTLENLEDQFFLDFLDFLVNPDYLVLQ